MRSTLVPVSRDTETPTVLVAEFDESDASLSLIGHYVISMFVSCNVTYKIRNIQLKINTHWCDWQ